MEYPRDAALAWYVGGGASDNQLALLRHLIVADGEKLKAGWNDLESLARTKFRCKGRLSPASPCRECAGGVRLYCMGPKYDYALWECAGCHNLWLSADRETSRCTGSKALIPAVDRAELSTDYRIQALNEILHDDRVSESEFKTAALLWFSDADSLAEWWSAAEDTARQFAPPPRACPHCAAGGLKLWRSIEATASVQWRCDMCKAVTTVDRWIEVNRILSELGATPEQLEQIREFAEREGLTPAEAADQVIQGQKERIARETVPPPESCPRCQEAEFEFVEISTTGAASKWKCCFCGRVELVSLGRQEKVGPIREAIPKAVQLEVWRRDEGKCTNCGSQRNLEYDHVIPVALGGSNTARNIQLLCEVCNRLKSANEPGNY